MSLRIIPLGGLGEIGMNCMVLEYEDEMLLIDCGILFSDLDHFGVELVIPDLAYVLARKEKFKGFIMTHGHEDHVGALPFALKAGLRGPVYASHFTMMLIEQRLKEYGLMDATELRPFKMGEKIKFKHFAVETASVNHSIVDAAALLIDTPVGKIIHTGDFRIDPLPFCGAKLDEKIFRAAGDKGVALLMSDSTNVERCDHSLSESVVYQNFEKLFAAAEGLTVVAMFASNVSRMGQIFDLAIKMGKKVALSGRSMETNVRLGQEANFLPHYGDVLINLNQIDEYARKDVIVLSTGSQGEFRSSLIRIARDEHPSLKLGAGDRVLMSSRAIPGNEKPISKMINEIFKQGAQVIYEAVHQIHASGHATRPELKDMLEWTRPKFFMPIHGEYRHLVHHADLARETGVPSERIKIATNGDILEFTGESFERLEKLEEPRIMIENREGAQVTKILLKERRQLGEKGVVFVLVVKSREDERVLSGPEIITKGIMDVEHEAYVLEEAIKTARAVVTRYEAELERDSYGSGPPFDLAETLRVELRRFFNANVGKKPTVIPVVMEA